MIGIELNALQISSSLSLLLLYIWSFGNVISMSEEVNACVCEWHSKLWAMRNEDCRHWWSKEGGETLFYLFRADEKFIPPRTYFARLSFRCVSSFPSVYRSLPTVKATSPVPSTPAIPIISLNPTAISSGHQPFNKVTQPRRRISLVVPGIWWFSDYDSFTSAGSFDSRCANMARFGRRWWLARLVWNSSNHLALIFFRV